MQGVERLASIHEGKKPFICTKCGTTDPPSKKDFKPSKQNHAQCSQPQKKRKDSLPPLACTQQAYGEKESFAWTGNFLKMLHTSKKSYFIQQVVIKWNKKIIFFLLRRWVGGNQKMDPLVLGMLINGHELVFFTGNSC